MCTNRQFQRLTASPHEHHHLVDHQVMALEQELSRGAPPVIRFICPLKRKCDLMHSSGVIMNKTVCHLQCRVVLDLMVILAIISERY